MLSFILFLALLAICYQYPYLLFLPFVLLAICLTIQHKNKKKKEEKEFKARLFAEERALKQAIKEATNYTGSNVKTVTTYETTTLDKGTCPYCGAVILLSEGKCKHCGSALSSLDKQTVVTETSEHQEVLQSIQLKHKERMEELRLTQEKEAADRRHKIIIVLIVAVAIVLLYLFIFLKN